MEAMEEVVMRSGPRLEILVVAVAAMVAMLSSPVGPMLPSPLVVAQKVAKATLVVMPSGPRLDVWEQVAMTAMLPCPFLEMRKVVEAAAHGNQLPRNASDSPVMVLAKVWRLEEAALAEETQVVAETRVVGTVEAVEERRPVGHRAMVPRVLVVAVAPTVSQLLLLQWLMRKATPAATMLKDERMSGLPAFAQQLPAPRLYLDPWAVVEGRSSTVARHTIPEMRVASATPA